MAAVTISWQDESVTSPNGEDTTVNQSMNILQFDAEERLSRKATAQVTNLAVEEGASLSDYKRADPQRVTLNGLVSKTPSTNPLPNGNGINSGILATYQYTEGVGTTITYSEENNNIQNVSDTLAKLVAQPISVTVATPLAVYENMQVIDVENVTTNEGLAAERFTVIFQQIVFGETEQVTITVPLQPRGASSRDNSAAAAQQDNLNNVTEEQDPRSQWLQERQRSGRGR